MVAFAVPSVLMAIVATTCQLAHAFANKESSEHTALESAPEANHWEMMQAENEDSNKVDNEGNKTQAVCSHCSCSTWMSLCCNNFGQFQNSLENKIKNQGWNRALGLSDVQVMRNENWQLNQCSGSGCYHHWLSTWANRQWCVQGKCATFKGELNQCGASSCTDQKGSSWCARKSHKCWKSSVQRKCACTCGSLAETNSSQSVMRKAIADEGEDAEEDEQDGEEQGALDESLSGKRSC